MGRKANAVDDEDDWVPADNRGKGSGGGASRRGGNATPPPSASGRGEGGGGGRSVSPAKGTTIVAAAEAALAKRATPPPQSAVQVAEKQRLETADRVFHRILWDSRLDPADFELGYEDRFKGILYMPVRKFRNTGDETSEIPFHRVHYFRYKGRVVWDRQNRIDVLDTLYDSHGRTMVASSLLAGVKDQSTLAILAPPETPPPPRGPPPLTGPAPAASPPPASSELDGDDDDEEEEEEGSGALPPPPPAKASTPPGSPPRTPVVAAADSSSKDPSTAAPSDAPLSSDAPPVAAVAAPPVPTPSPPLTLATFNVLFDLFDADKIHTQQRIPLICRELEALDADILCLQEMTAPIMSGIRGASPVLRDRYYWTALPKDTKTAQVILSKHPISEAVSAQMSKNKRCIYAVVNVDLQPIVVVNCHLISDYGGEASVDRRVNELRTIFAALAPHRRAILMGDFNFGDTNPEQGAVNWLDFVDCHLATHSNIRDEPGFTFDITRNPLAEYSCKHHRYPRRLDRILVRGFDVAECRIFADAPKSVLIPKSPTPLDLFPSDHFGVVARVAMLPDAVLAAAGGAGSSHVDPAAAAAGGGDGIPGAAGSLGASVNDFFPYFRSALVIIPPKTLHAAIDGFREGHDKAFPRWMPHISLLFPFVHPAKFPQAIEVIEACLSRSTVKPFPVTVRKANHFDAKKPVVFLVPEADEREMCGLHALLQPLFPSCGRQEGPFQPHLTLGQVDKSELPAFLERVKATWTPTTFTVAAIHLIAHIDDHAGYEIVHSFPLDRESGRPPLTAAAAAAAGAPGLVAPVVPAAFNISDMVMEDPQWGSKLLEPYIPKDPLEMWMARVNVREYARAAPTHISQKGGMYHVPSELIDAYLERWRESIDQSHDTPFFVEEVRGNPFRLYVDIDVKRTVEVPFDASRLITRICEFAKLMFPKAEVTVLSLECHGEWKDSKDPAVRFKSGFRIYFQRIFVTEETYRRFLRRLAQWCRSNVELDIVGLPDNTSWDDVVDQHCADWERGRLLGTIKRRKSLQRIYTFHAMFNDTGRLSDVSAVFAADIRRVMYGQTLRLWNALPSVPGVLQDNSFRVERLYTQLEGLRAESSD